MGLAISQTKNTLKDALLRFGKAEKKQDFTAKDVQILIYTDDAENLTPKFKLMKKYNPTDDITFQQILDTKFDFLGREQLAVPFLMKTFARVATEKKCKPTDVQIVAFTHNDKAEKIRLYLYLNYAMKHELEFEYLFQEDGLEAEQQAHAH